MENRIRGAIYGSVVGDALGGAVDSLTGAAIRERYGVLRDMTAGGSRGGEPGATSDDTEMMLAVAEGLLANFAFPSREIGRRFLAWYSANPLGVGTTTAASMDNFLRIGSWHQAARVAAQSINKNDSNGGLMRTLPVTFGYWYNLQLMAARSVEIAFMTHYSHEGAACCIFYNYLVYLATYQCVPKRAMVTAAVEFTNEQCKLLALSPSRFFWYVIKNLQTGAEPVPPSEGVLETLVAAVQCFMAGQDFEETLVEVVNRGGDTDTGGTVAGGLAGAFYGFEDIPRRWVEPLKNKERLEQVLADFIALYRDKTHE